MSQGIPQPGHGYTVRQYLGGGYWKKAFRAVSHLSMRDVAVLVYKDPSARDEMLKDMEIWLKIKNQPGSEYLATFYEVFGGEGEDENIYFIEELLSRPLDRLTPLRSGERFLRIARDLCRGLQCLHSVGLVHRDLKLDNCGVDHSDRAKIFDLGSATSEPGSVAGTMLTRAPE
jgi:serine/threonine protein kinase